MSQRITKQIAKDVARDLAKPHYAKWQAKSEELKDLITEVYMKTVPDSIKKLSNKNSQYLKYTNSVSFIGNGFNHEYGQMHDSPTKDGYRTPIEPSIEDSKKIQKLMKEKDDLCKHHNDLKQEIEIALQNLRTYSKVEKEFPEAFKLLPNSIPTSLAININDIRAKL